jgi:hypothetical protein
VFSDIQSAQISHFGRRIREDGLIVRAHFAATGAPSGHRSQVAAEDDELFYVNPTDRFVIGGADRDAGLAGG